MRTDQEIIDRINARKEADFFGFDLTDYQYYGKDNLVKICDHYG